jgi:hypothetical protein
MPSTTNLFEPGSLSRYSDAITVGRSGNRIPRGARFSTLVQTGPLSRPAFYTLGTGSFPEVKRLERGVKHSFPSSAKKEQIYTFAPPLGFHSLL